MRRATPGHRWKPSRQGARWMLVRAASAPVPFPPRPMCAVDGAAYQQQDAYYCADVRADGWTGGVAADGAADAGAAAAGVAAGAVVAAGAGAGCSLACVCVCRAGGCWRWSARGPSRWWRRLGQRHHHHCRHGGVPAQGRQNRDAVGNLPSTPSLRSACCWAAATRLVSSLWTSPPPKSPREGAAAADARRGQVAPLLVLRRAALGPARGAGVSRQRVGSRGASDASETYHARGARAAHV